jgi:hypothetical protein
MVEYIASKDTNAQLALFHKLASYVNYTKMMMQYAQKMAVMNAKVSLFNDKGDVLISSCVVTNQDSSGDQGSAGPEFADISVFEKYDHTIHKLYADAEKNLMVE